MDKPDRCRAEFQTPNCLPEDEQFCCYRAKDKHIIETEATVIEIDRQKWAIVLITFDYGSLEAKLLVNNEVCRLLVKHDNLLPAMWRSNGKLEVVASPELEEKICAKISPNHKWVKVRIYPPPK